MVVGHPTGESTDAATGPAVDSGATADSRRICSSSIRARRPARRAPFDLQMPEAPTSVCGPMAGSPAGEIRPVRQSRSHHNSAGQSGSAERVVMRIRRPAFSRPVALTATIAMVSSGLIAGAIVAPSAGAAPEPRWPVQRPR